MDLLGCNEIDIPSWMGWWGAKRPLIRFEICNFERDGLVGFNIDKFDKCP